MARMAPGNSGPQGPGNLFGGGNRSTRRSSDHIDMRGAFKPNAAEAGRSDQSILHSPGRSRAAGPAPGRAGERKKGAAGG